MKGQVASPTRARRGSQPARSAARRGFALRWLAFVSIGLLLYAGAYALSEHWVDRYGQRNRFFMVATTPPTTFDFVILGASHAMPLGYQDMNERLEERANVDIMNLSMEGGGILPNQLVFDYFLEKHDTRNVLYVVDSFAFYSEQWNEERLTSADLLRAPLDLDLVRTLWRHPWARDTLLPYVSGFAKLNDSDRFEPDVSEAERTKFERSYRPIAQIDRQRIEFLYPEAFPEATFEGYLAELRALAETARAHGAELILLRPPAPERVREMVPHEDVYWQRLQAFAEEEGLSLHDHASTVQEEELYYDTDHLNREGVRAFMDRGLAELLSNPR